MKFLKGGGFNDVDLGVKIRKGEFNGYNEGGIAAKVRLGEQPQPYHCLGLWSLMTSLALNSSVSLSQNLIL